MPATYDSLKIVAAKVSLICKATGENLGAPVRLIYYYGGDTHYMFPDGKVFSASKVYPDTPQGHAEYAAELEDQARTIRASLPAEWQPGAPKATKASKAKGKGK